MKAIDYIFPIFEDAGGKEGMGDQEVIRHTRGIDLVLGGHSHTYFKKLRYVDNADGNPTPDDQNGKSGIYIGKMRLTLAHLK